MKPHDFCASSWVKRLAQSLVSLAAIEGKYCSELSIIPTDDENRNMRIPTYSGYRSQSRSSLYSQVETDKGSSYYKSLSSYGPFYCALKAVEKLLREQPVLNRTLGTSDSNEFRVFTPNIRGLPINLIQVKAGLMNCATKSNFDDAASKLQELLTSGEKRRLKGYHISIFRGLRLDDEMELSDGISIAPFEKIKEFIVPSFLESVVWDFNRFRQTGPLGVILKPFQWGPLILPSNANPERDIPWAEGFHKDAEIIVDLLSIAHGAPMVTIMSIHDCVDPQIWNIFGVPFPGGGISQYGGVPILDSAGNTPLSMGKFSEVKDAFYRLKHQNNDLKKYKSVIPRLSSSLLRKGRLRSEDKILDVAIALELMYEPDSPEVTYKLAMRASSFLEDDPQKRLDIFNKIKAFYSARSSVVHSKKTSGAKNKDISEQFDNGFDLARRTLFKLLQSGSPSDWNEFVLSGGG